MRLLKSASGFLEEEPAGLGSEEFGFTNQARGSEASQLRKPLSQPTSVGYNGGIFKDEFSSSSHNQLNHFRENLQVILEGQIRPSKT